MAISNQDNILNSNLKELIDLLKPYIKSHKYWFVFLNIIAIVAAIAQTMFPLIIGDAIDNAFSDLDLITLQSTFFILIGLVLLDLLAQFGARYIGLNFAQRIIFDIRQNIFIKLQNQELDFYSKETTGQIMAKTMEEVYSLRDILTWGYRMSILMIFLFLGAISSMITLGISEIPNNNFGPFYLALAFFVIPVIIFITISKTSANNRLVFYNARFKFGEMSEAMAENLSGIHTVKSFGSENEQIEIFNEKNHEFYDAALKGAQVRGLLQPGVIFIIGLAIVFLVFIGGYLVSIESITPGTFITFMLLSLQIALPGRFIGWVGIITQDANSAAIRLNEIFKSTISVNDYPNAKAYDNVDGKIQFSNVTFSYDNNSLALNDINLKIAKGENIVLLGQTGSGKSSLVNLIPRFFDPISGQVLIDNIDIKDFTLNSLRRNIGVVHQDAFLFTMSIHDNIAFGKPNASREEVIISAKAAQIHEYIMTLDHGYDTIVGERGVTLSGGQRQRVTIARVLLKNPKILIFDDSVSAVDPKTEKLIMENLKNVSSNRTTIIISQRASSLKFADRIVVLDGGTIKQIGSHSELITVEGIYKEFIKAVNEQVKFMDWSDNDEQKNLSKIIPEESK
ncbi:MAG: ABC transporter ATP-binding protein [Candidatus Kariarchaeum pelagius]